MPSYYLRGAFPHQWYQVYRRFYCTLNTQYRIVSYSVIPVVNRVNYLGCYFSAPSAEVDLSPSLGKFHGSFHNICVKMFNSCWRESPRSLQFYCGCLPAWYLIDQHRLLFWKKMLTSNNVLLRILSCSADSCVNLKLLLWLLNTVFSS